MAKLDKFEFFSGVQLSAGITKLLAETWMTAGLNQARLRGDTHSNVWIPHFKEYFHVSYSRTGMEDEIHVVLRREDFSMVCTARYTV